MTNNTNDSSKRTASQVAAILIANGCPFKPENTGDGRKFLVNDTSFRTLVQIKKAGFILHQSNATDKVLYFSAF
jgi:hypothetical protein